MKTKSSTIFLTLALAISLCGCIDKDKKEHAVKNDYSNLASAMIEVMSTTNETTGTELIKSGLYFATCEGINEAGIERVSNKPELKELISKNIILFKDAANKVYPEAPGLSEEVKKQTIQLWDLGGDKKQIVLKAAKNCRLLAPKFSLTLNEFKKTE